MELAALEAARESAQTPDLAHPENAFEFKY
jgi:hypothetical protein